jgi:hypothetical protein
MALHSILQCHDPLFTPEERTQYEREIAAFLGLDSAVQAGLLSRYWFQWSRYGILRNIKLVPHPKVRRTPGIKRIKELFFSKKSHEYFT